MKFHPSYRRHVLQAETDEGCPKRPLPEWHFTLSIIKRNGKVFEQNRCSDNVIVTVRLSIGLP